MTKQRVAEWTAVLISTLIVVSFVKVYLFY
ncbi:UNVERIFIED_ORG: hypothetical protein J2Y78_002082 [Buttiauxella agrestis ATCC 33320]